jgi:hypothetical protein
MFDSNNPRPFNSIYTFILWIIIYILLFITDISLFITASRNCSYGKIAEGMLCTIFATTIFWILLYILYFVINRYREYITVTKLTVGLLNGQTGYAKLNSDDINNDKKDTVIIEL